MSQNMINKYTCLFDAPADVQSCSEEDVPSPAADTVEMIPGSQLLWRIAPRPANSTQVSHFYKSRVLNQDVFK